MIIHYSSPSLKGTADQKELWYGVEYSVQPIEASLLQVCVVIDYLYL